MNVKVKQAFTPVPMVSYRSSRKFSTYLVRAKLYRIKLWNLKVVAKNYVLTYVKQICLLAQSVEKLLKSIINLIVPIGTSFIFLRASAVANYLLEKPLGSLG